MHTSVYVICMCECVFLCVFLSSPLFFSLEHKWGVAGAAGVPTPKASAGLTPAPVPLRAVLGQGAHSDLAVMGNAWEGHPHRETVLIDVRLPTSLSLLLGLILNVCVAVIQHSPIGLN